MEKGLNKNSISNIRKSYKRTHASKSSLDDAILKHFDVLHSPVHTNIRRSVESSLMRNTFNSKSNTNDAEFFKIKTKKTNKKANLKEIVNDSKRFSSGNFTCNITPNKSKCASIIHINTNQSQISKYKFIYQIGFGGFGKVWKVLKKKTYKQFAMKQINKKKVIQKQNVESILNERIILSSISHPFLINMHSSFQDEYNLYLTMDYLRGADLRYHICYKEHFNEQQIKFIVACIIIGLQYVHEKKIIHRDIKPENIVFQQSGYARITDFGIAKQQTSNNLPSKFESSGTPGYMAPQILCKMPYSFESDFFALGVMIYELILGHRPYEGKNRQQIRQNILRNQAHISQNQLPKGFHKSVIDFVNGLIERNPEQRLGFNGIKQLKSHKWLKDIKWKALQRKQVLPPFKPNVICQTKEYLQQIILYNQMKTNDQNIQKISSADQRKFENYNYKKVDRQKMKSQKFKAGQNQLVSSKSKQFLKTLHNNYSTVMLKSNNPTLLMKKNRRNSQEKMVF